MGTVDDLTLLVEIIEAGSLSAASRKTGIAKSSLSRRIGDLETQLGVYLFYRGPRNFSVTEIGLSIFERGQKIKDELEAIKALAEDSSKRPTGALRISCPAVLTERIVAEFAINFSTAHPDVRITLDSSIGTVDPSIGHYDLAIHPARGDTMADSELVRQKLVSLPYGLVASAELTRSLGKIAMPLDLENQFGIGWAADGFLSRWKLTDRVDKTAELNVNLRFSANNLNVIKQAALNGLGLARLPLIMCETDLLEGRLVLPLPDWSPPSITIYALYPSRRSLTLAGRLFIAGLARHLQEHLPSA
ncbi:LysR family transcriptional regulator [Bradyrhizobium sp. Ai1a-2]|uniref:LysR family transcriptional regulator n=1 Tax=Bradyrhizobium sp. Ai1a-2 TaxID=196490 RepID=UPI000408AB8A|nr:LysR family transcriptional regulator [Bradyrhizobium sp. Ai1a-2]